MQANKPFAFAAVYILNFALDGRSWQILLASSQNAVQLLSRSESFKTLVDDVAVGICQALLDGLDGAAARALGQAWPRHLSGN